MKNLKRVLSVVMSIILCAGALSSCGKSSVNSSDVKSDVSTISEEILQSIAEDSVDKPDTSEATIITLSDKSATVSGSGAEAKDGVVTITKGGSYVVSGKISDGRVIVNAPKEEVTVVLQDASVTCSYGSPIYVYKSSLTTVYLADGTTNTLTDGKNYTFNDGFSSSDDEEPNACLYSKSDLVIAGGGELVVNANYNNGITSKDTLKIESSSIIVTAKNHGINGKDCCSVKDANIKVTSSGDALRSTNDSDTSLGYIVIVDSVLDLTSGEDGIQAETALQISGGSCTIKSGGGSDKEVDSETSAKGIKAGTSIKLSSGTYKLDCCDDAIHSNGNVEILDGNYSISTGDDGIHADKNVKIDSGTINVNKSYEGIEGAVINISGGKIKVVASDDGLNAAGGADQSGFGGMRQQDPDTFDKSSDYSINISGGTINIDASGDGIDSNGDLTVSGGEVYVSGPTDNGNSALDYDGNASITGGVVIAAGSSGMAQNFGSNSTQGSILLNCSSNSNESISVTDSSGKVLAEYTPSKNYTCVVVSCPDLTKGNTYTVKAGGESTSVTLDDLIYGETFGMNGGGPGGEPGDMGGRPGEQQGERPQ